MSAASSAAASSAAASSAAASSAAASSAAASSADHTCPACADPTLKVEHHTFCSLRPRCSLCDASPSQKCFACRACASGKVTARPGVFCAASADCEKCAEHIVRERERRVLTDIMAAKHHLFGDFHDGDFAFDSEHVLECIQETQKFLVETRPYRPSEGRNVSSELQYFFRVCSDKEEDLEGEEWEENLNFFREFWLHLLEMDLDWIRGPNGQRP